MPGPMHCSAPEEYTPEATGHRGYSRPTVKKPAITDTSYNTATFSYRVNQPDGVRWPSMPPPGQNWLLLQNSRTPPELAPYEFHNSVCWLMLTVCTLL
jgi:hypothetical protein